jgi:flagellar biosynthesis GTPase FlhF
MTFQNLIARVPKWNQEIVQNECKRIVEKSNCNYLEELISCVHIIQLKLLTCIRVGKQQKKIDISIPVLNEFIHKTYIFTARKLYANVYLYESNIPPLQKQKNLRELELIIQDAILLSIRDSMPVENILRAYMDETVEHDVSKEVIEEKVEVEVEPEKEEETTTQKTITNSESLDDQIKDQEETIKKMVEKNTLTFNDVDKTLNENNEEVEISAPKNIERLEEISELRNKQRREEEEEEEDEIFNSKIKIEDAPVNLTELDIHDLSDKPKINLEISDPILDDVEVLV